MDNIQLYYIDNEINKIDKMKQGDVIYKNGVELLVVLSYDRNEPCKGCFFYEDKACGSERLIICHHDTYVGRRVRRGLFMTRDGILINADINGSYNIMRKVKGDAAMPPHTGFGYNPVKKFIN